MPDASKFTRIDPGERNKGKRKYKALASQLEALGFSNKEIAEHRPPDRKRRNR